MDSNSRWVKCFLGDIVSLRNGYAFKSTEYQEQGIPIVRISDINDGVVELTDSKCIYQHEEFEKFSVDSGDILIAMSGATTGKFGIYKGSVKAYQNQRVGNLKPVSETNTDKHFVYYLLFSLKRRIEKDAYGGAQPNISGSKVEAIEIALPPLNEQHRIVAKIEELFSELDKGVENLKTAQAQLKVYRQALLKHAFEGKLTVQWREQHRAKQSVAPAKAGVQPLNDMDSRPTLSRGLALHGNDEVGSKNDEPLETAADLLKRIQQESAQRYQQQLTDWEASDKQGSKPKPPKSLPPLTAEKLAELPELPEGWVYSYLADLGELGRGKSKHRPRNDPRLFGGIYPFIQTGEVKSANRIIRQYSQTYSDFGLQQSKLWPTGTLCITIAANIAETAFLGFDGCFPDSVVGFSAFKKTIIPEYVDFFIQAARMRIEAYAPATAQKNINLETLENLVVPYCCLEEQRKILDILEERFSVIDQLDQTITTALQQAEALRQSILKKAFSGQLVPQDPNDEPVSELLARIKAERVVNKAIIKP